MAEGKDKWMLNYKMLTRDGKTIIKFNDELQQEIEIPTVEYEKLKGGLKTDDYEPEKLGLKMKDWMIDFEVRSLQERDVVGFYYRCDTIVKIGEGVVLLNSSGNVYHRKPCFELDRKYYEI